MLERIRGSAAAFREALPAAGHAQERLLLDLLHRHSGCEYGRRHGFELIRDAAQFARRVPIVTYEELRPHIERMADGADDILVSTRVIAFEETGGSSGGRKLIPYTDASLAAFRRGVSAWLDDLYTGDPALGTGSAYWSISPAARAPGRTHGGIPIGLDDLSYLGPALAAEVAASFSVPPAVAAITDLDRWRHDTCVHLLADERLALISVWSPTFLLQLLEFMAEHARPLCEAVARGHERVQGNPRRAAEIARALSEPTPDYAALWPRLRLISCWTDASSRPFAAALHEKFPRTAVQGKGLLATEGLMSIPLRELDWPVLAIESGFFEFLGGDGRAHTVESLEAGEEYEILLTNDSGLYRYAIGDRVRAHAFAGGAPLIEFLGRAGIASDLVGEKLTEAFVSKALHALGLRFAALAVDESRYTLLVDEREVAPERLAALAAACDAALCANPQYAYARDLGQLGPVRAQRCVDPLRTEIARGLARGQKLGDIKPAALIADRAFSDRFVDVDA